MLERVLRRLGLVEAALLEATHKGNIVEIKRLLETKNVDVDIVHPDSGAGALYIAASYDRVHVLRELLAHGADVMLVDDDDRTALHIASSEGFINSVRELLTHGADPNAPDKEGWTPLHVAAQYGHLAVVEALLSHGAIVDVTEELGMTPLWISSQHGQVEVTRLLLSKGADTSVVVKEGWSPLYAAVQFGFLDVVQELLRYGADPNFGTPPGGVLDSKWHVIHVACEYGHVDILRELLAHGASVNTLSNHNNDGPVHVAAAHHRVAVLQVLLDHGCSATTRNMNWKTPLDLCLQWKSDTTDFVAVMEIAHMLMSKRGTYDASPDHFPAVKAKCQSQAAIIPICVRHWAEQKKQNKHLLTKVPVEIFKRGPKAVEMYLREIETSDEHDVVLRRKVCFVGSSKAGKTSLIKSMMRLFPTLEKEEDRTIGVDLFRHEFIDPKTNRVHNISILGFCSPSTT
ncbi:hypothetical protein Poli38472_001898 [Pythium oligandrum]|uniref:Non-specific serine/threonine protein kinase n=1 Tax=Pythium oligandrum TaxID=41045 RepID=A0A8K1CTP1_PYTOL|nr:hypothetical protein Poli38472_001898 [Pythium oligandrum]|eukprot:TMW69742.1 hypothetical protein Poli38472_001898 [Pythium oligandrum]